MDRAVAYSTFTQMILSAGGLWKTQTHRQRLLRYCIIGFMSLHAIFSESYQLLTSSFDFRAVLRALQIFVPTICGIAQYYNAVLHYNTIHKIYCFVLNDWELLRDDTELKIMQKYAYYGNLMTSGGFVVCYFYLVTLISPPLLRIITSTNEIRNDLDLYPIISWFDYFSNRETYYYPVLIYQVLTAYVLVMVSIASYAMYVLFIQHACARLSIIIYRIYSPFTRNNYNDNVIVTPIDCSPWIIDIVQCLAKITEFMTLINRAFETSYLIQISLGFLLLILDFLCVPVLLDNEHTTTMKDVLGVLIYISGTLFTIYVNCYFGQTVIDYSTDIYREVSLVPFHDMSLVTQKLLLITLKMSAKPFVASIGKVYVASHEFFSNFLRSALSFAMVVHSVQTV